MSDKMTKEDIQALAAGKDYHGLTEQDLVQHCVNCWQVSDEARLAKKRQWDENWTTYNNDFDFSEKAEWQSKGFLPKFKLAVRVAAYTFRRAILSGGAIFRAVGMNEESREIAPDITKAINRALMQSNLRSVLFEGLLAGLLESHINLKIYPVPLDVYDFKIHPLQKVKLRIDAVSSYDLCLDPKGRNRWKVHRVTMDYSDFVRLCNEGVYKKSVLVKIEESFIKLEEERKRQIREGLNPPPKQDRKEVELLEYWGDVDDKSGKRAYTGVTYTVVNRKFLAKDPEENPLGVDPFVYGPIIRTPFATYSESFGDGTTQIARMINEHYNLINDQALAASMNAYEINLDYISNPSQLASGIYPGKAITVQGVMPGAQAVREISVGRISAEAQAVLINLDREFQNATGIPEFITTSVGVGSKTATEVKTKHAQAASLLREMGEDIDTNVLRPLVQRVYHLFMKFNPEVFGPRINQVPPDALQFDFEVAGVASYMKNMEEMQQLMMIINILRGTPAANKINWVKVTEKLLRYAGWEPDELLLNENELPSAPPGMGPTQGEMAQNAEMEQNVLMNLMRGGKQ